MSESYTGATVRYCGHRGTFIADIFRIAGSNVLRSIEPIRPETLNRENLEDATHYVSDFPDAGFWRPDLGVLVVPEAQVKLLTVDEDKES